MARPARLTRVEQQALTKERLLAAAETVFAQRGYGGASVDLIAAEAGYSKGAVYSNFPSKEAIFLELARRHLERDLLELERIVASDPAEIDDAVSGWLRTMHSKADVPALLIELELHARRSPDFASSFYTLRDQKLATLAQIISGYFHARGVKPPMNVDDLARIFDTLGVGLALQKAALAPGQPNEAGRIIFDLLGLLARPA